MLMEEGLLDPAENRFRLPNSRCVLNSIVMLGAFMLKALVKFPERLRFQNPGGIELRPRPRPLSGGQSPAPQAESAHAGRR